MMDFSIGSFFVHSGYAAIRVGKYWVGCASGNRSTDRLRMTPEKAIEDAKKHFKEMS